MSRIGPEQAQNSVPPCPVHCPPGVRRNAAVGDARPGRVGHARPHAHLPDACPCCSLSGLVKPETLPRLSASLSLALGRLHALLAAASSMDGWPSSATAAFLPQRSTAAQAELAATFARPSRARSAVSSPSLAAGTVSPLEQPRRAACSRGHGAVGCLEPSRAAPRYTRTRLCSTSTPPPWEGHHHRAAASPPPVSRCSAWPHLLGPPRCEPRLPTGAHGSPEPPSTLGRRWHGSPPVKTATPTACSVLIRDQGPRAQIRRNGRT
jgi:hypothetical protein